MSTLRTFLAATLVIAITILPAAAQQQYGPLERGWRTGYSDGYQSGWQDSLEGRAANHQSKEEYTRADRAYVAAYGSLEDYRDGYRQGFEAGYAEGFARRGFNSELPAEGIKRRGVSDDAAARPAPRTDANSEDDDVDNNQPRNAQTTPTRGARSIPRDTIMRVELLNRLSTDVSKSGDRFEARVIEPQEYEGAVVGGRVSNVERAGKVRGRSQLQLSFDQIRLPDGDWMDFSAQVIEVVSLGDDEGGEVDAEGGVRGRSTTKDDIAKVGAASGVGAIIGAITGGGKGAAIGAIIGAGVGTGGVMTQRGKDIRFERGQQLRIRTSGDASID